MDNVNMKFKLIHDSNKILCFIGSSYINKTLKDYFDQYRDCEIYRIEEIQNQNQDWFDARQFFTASGDILLKKKIAEILDHHHGDCFSVIADRNHIGFNVNIGKSTYIDDFNTLLDNTVVGDFVLITHNVVLSHEVEINDFCHIGPSVYFLFAKIGKGSYIAAKSNFLGKSTSHIKTADHCNYLIGSTITKNILHPGTYYNNRCVEKSTSIERKID